VIAIIDPWYAAGLALAAQTLTLSIGMISPMNIRYATLEMDGQELLIIRLAEGTRVQDEVISDVLEAMNTMRFSGPVSVLLDLPDNITFDAEAVCSDHAHLLDPRLDVCALAVVTPSLLPVVMTELHFSFFPTPIAVRCFREMNEARAWAMENVLELSVA
jgi:hypothetical protein